MEKYKFDKEKGPEENQMEFFKNEISVLNTTLSGEGYRLNTPTFNEDDSIEVKIANIKAVLQKILEEVDQIKTS